MSYNNIVGAKYEATKGLNRVAIAALIRADIKAAVKTSTLPKAAYSVRCSGSSIDITVSKVEPASFQIHNAAHLAWTDENPCAYPGDAPVGARERYTAEAQAILDTCDRIAAEYNYDHSEIESDYFNVRFYGNATFEWRYAAAAKVAELAAVRADRAAKSIAAITAPAANDVTDPSALTQDQIDWLRGLGVEAVA